MRRFVLFAVVLFLVFPALANRRDPLTPSITDHPPVTMATGDNTCTKTACSRACRAYVNNPLCTSLSWCESNGTCTCMPFCLGPRDTKPHIEMAPVQPDRECGDSVC